MKGTARLVDRTYAYLAGTSGTVTVPIGGRVTGWAAFATGAGATVTVAGGAAIPIPTGGSVEGNPPDDSALLAPTFVFTSTSGYFVEYVI